MTAWPVESVDERFDLTPAGWTATADSVGTATGPVHGPHLPTEDDMRALLTAYDKACTQEITAQRLYLAAQEAYHEAYLDYCLRGGAATRRWYLRESRYLCAEFDVEHEARDRQAATFTALQDGFALLRLPLACD